MALTLLVAIFTTPASSQSLRTWDVANGVTPDQHCFFSRLAVGAGQAVLGPAALTVSGSATTDALWFSQSGPEMAVPPTWVITARLRVESDFGAEPAATSASISFTTSPDRGNILFIGMDRIFLWSDGFTIDTEFLTDTHTDFQDYRIEITGTSVAVFVGGSSTPDLVGSTLDLADFEDVPTLGWGDGTSLASGIAHWRSVTHNGNVPKPCELFFDDFEGPAASEIIGTIPEVGGSAWTGAGLQPSGQFRFAASGVEDVGPNGLNAMVHSVLAAPYSLSELAEGEVLRLSVTMSNRAGSPPANLLQSSRVDLGSTTSGNIMMGEIATGGTWGANSDAGDAIPSGVSTGTPGRFDLQLYLDPRDEFADGPTFNAAFRLGDGCLVPGSIQNLSTGTVVAALRLVRNIDDEVLFDDLRLASVPVPASGTTVLFHDALDDTLGTELIGTIPDQGGGPWTGGGSLSSGEFRFADGGGVTDEGPNARIHHAIVTSALTGGVSFASLAQTAPIRLRVTMRNLAADPAVNPFESTRVDLRTDDGNWLYLGELHTAGDFASSSSALVPMPSSVSTRQGARTDLELFLDPYDAIGDGASYNALLRVNSGPPIRGLLASLTPNTVLTDLQLVRNVDDEVLFDDLTLDVACVPPSVLDAPERQASQGSVRLAAAPNPFRSDLGIRLTLAEAAALRVSVHDVAGRLVRVLHDTRTSPGELVFRWDGRDAADRAVGSGVYFVRARAEGRAFGTSVVRMR